MTPLDVEMLEQLLSQTNYDPGKTRFLVDGFKNGFRLGYTGNRKVRLKSPNLKFQGIGNEVELWNKVMKEVKLGRYAGPFEKIPFDYYIQSPIGLVPQDNGRSTRLIFHLSYPRNTKEKLSVNANTDPKACSVSYPDFTDAIRLCIKTGKSCRLAKSDMTSAFRNLGMSKLDFCLLIMKAKDPKTGIFKYFVDKCLPFGASISCAHFQTFSNAVAHIVRAKTGKDLINYLDDYFFTVLMKLLCNSQVQTFLDICKLIKFPVSLEKTFWATTQLVFLGLLIDTVLQTVSLPKEKIDKANELITKALMKKKITLHDSQKICGLLNFMGRAIVPGRSFTRRLYASTVGKTNLKPHHHIRITQSMRLDLQTWKQFLAHQAAFSRLFMDFTKFYTVDEIDFFSDASKNSRLGMGAVCENSWMMQQWDSDFVEKMNPSIEYLELYAVVAAFLNWVRRFMNRRIVVFCDNISVVYMINKTSSTCKNCMALIRILVLSSMIENVRVYMKYVQSKKNFRADMLSRLKIKQFKELFPNSETSPTPVPEMIWPMAKIWIQ